jgi:ubiquinone/menaquinone biosynthesis C-methylase UbiE
MTQTATEGWQLQGSSAEAYERYLATAFSPWADALVTLGAIEPGERVLDVACGTGIVARHAAARAGARGKVVGLDLNPDMLRVAARMTAGSTPSIEWREGNAAELPFPDGAFDVAFCEQAFQFFSDPVTVLREIRRVLAPDGRLALSVCRPIAHSPAYIAMGNALDRYVSPTAGAIMRSPFSIWSVNELRDLFGAAGFDARVRIDVWTLRYPSVEEFVRREALSSPLADALGSLNVTVRTDLIRHLETALADHVDDDGVLCPVETYVVLARRTR